MKKRPAHFTRPDGARQLLLALCIVLLSACNGDAAQFRFDDYKTRLARSLKLDAAEAAEPIDPARRPRKREMQLEQDSAQITMLDFLRLYDCALGEVIGEQNSVLGKVAPASQRLFNDLEFLQLAPTCIEKLTSKQNDKLAGKLTDAVEIKRDGLAKAIANATLASDEFGSLWRVPSVLEEFPARSGSLPIDELRYIESEVARWLSGDYLHDSGRFEKALGALRYGQAGSLIAAAVLTQSHFTSASQMVQQRREGRPLCFNGTVSNQGRILRRVVDKYLVGEILLWLSRVNALRYDMLEPYLALEKHLSIAQTPAYRQWQARRDVQLEWLSSAPRQHVKAIRPILASCGLAPGA